MSRLEQILLAHGSGGRLTGELVRDIFLPALTNRYLATLTDSAILEPLPAGRPAMTTDGFVVDPPVFPGGDLGYLSVCGTVNDLAVAGARPLWLTWALILEEGCPTDLLETVVAGAARASEEAGIYLVAGDTKVVPRGKGDRVFAVTSGLGVVPPDRVLGDHRVTPGDAMVASGMVGDHGATVLACRHEMSGEGLRSDCAPLGSLIEAALESGADVRSMHDPTRGGVATVCHEVSGRADVHVVLEEDRVPVRPETRATCELLGLDPLYLACEGRVLFWVAAQDCGRLLEVLHSHPLGRDAARIGRVEEAVRGRAPVRLESGTGAARPVDLLSGSDLPRIC